MTTRPIDQNDLDRLMRQWMDDESAVHEPADLVGRVLAGTRRSRQLPAWLVFDRWIQMQLTMRRAAAPRLAPLLLLVGLLVAALLATLIYVGSRPKLPPPFGVADNGRIAFLSSNQLYTIQPDGSEVLQITDDPNGAATPVFSHDGTRIAYKRLSDDPPADDPTAVGDLVVMNADGSNPVVIAVDVVGMSPTSWSPDDRQVLWTGTDIVHVDEQVFLAPADGSSPPLQIGDRDTFNWAPSWSPDGTRIAYISGPDLYVMNTDGTDIRKVNQGVYDGQHGGAWYPDGSGLVMEAGAEENHDLWLVGLNGTLERPLATSSQTETSPAFSPDGEWIAFLRFAPDLLSSQVVIAKSDGSSERTLPGEFGFSGLAWSPDGTRLLVGAVSRSLVYDVDAFGSTERRILDLPGSPQFPNGEAELPAWQRIAN